MSEQPPDDAGAGRQQDAPAERAVPGQLPGDAAPPPVPTPGAGSPGVRVAQGPSPDTGINAGEKGEDSDASVTSPGAWTAAAAPGKPDGEVNTRG